MARGQNKAETQRNMQMVLAAFRNAGFSENQARSLAAEVGRENNFQSRYLWGTHTDPYKGKGILTNLGMISWNGSRGARLRKYLESQGLMQNGKIIQGQESLNAQARFLMDEIKNDPSYRQTRKLFLENPNVDFDTARRVLGKNFIRWRFDDPKYSSGHATVRNYYKQLGGVVPTEGEGKIYGDYLNTPNTPATPNALNTTPSAEGVNTNLFAGTPFIQSNPNSPYFGSVMVQAFDPYNTGANSFLQSIGAGPLNSAGGNVFQFAINPNQDLLAANPENISPVLYTSPFAFLGG